MTAARAAIAMRACDASASDATAAADDDHDHEDDGLLVASPTRFRHYHGVSIDRRHRLSIYVDSMPPFETGTLPDANGIDAIANNNDRS